MNFRQTISKKFYPLMMGLNRIFNTNRTILKNQENINPSFSFYNLTSIDNKNNIINFSSFKGKKILVVNTASDCGFTAQYNELQKLYEEFINQLVVLGFPSNNFKEQEKKSDEKIAEFCRINFGITFPLMKKSKVLKDKNQNEVYKWLTDARSNGWNDHQPDWNFSKYLINEEGILLCYFGPAISPLSDEILASVKKSI